MKMSFLPGHLHLYTDEDGHTCLVLKEEMIGRFRSQKEGIQKFKELRAILEKEHPSREPSQDEKREALIREIGESLTRHNSLRNAGPRKRTGTRTFG
jgi:hypothetical protein